MKQAGLTSICKWIPGMWLELPKQSLNAAKSIPWGFAEGGEDKDQGGVSGNVSQNLLTQQCVRKEHSVKDKKPSH